MLLSGLRQSDVADCISWMRPFADVLERQNLLELKKFPGVPADNAHNIQTHTVSLELLVGHQLYVSLTVLSLSLHCQCYHEKINRLAGMKRTEKCRF